MGTGLWIREHVRFLGIVAMSLCGVGAAAGMFIALVRVPALDGTKLELLLGTLLGLVVALLFIVIAFLTGLMIMVHAATRRPAAPRGWGGPEVEDRTRPAA